MILVSAPLYSTPVVQRSVPCSQAGARSSLVSIRASDALRDAAWAREPPVGCVQGAAAASVFCGWSARCAAGAAKRGICLHNEKRCGWIPKGIRILSMVFH